MGLKKEKQSITCWSPRSRSSWREMAEIILKEIMTEMFPILGSYLDIQFHEAH